jgi:hypothetical protein
VSAGRVSSAAHSDDAYAPSGHIDRWGLRTQPTLTNCPTNRPTNRQPQVSFHDVSAHPSRVPLLTDYFGFDRAALCEPVVEARTHAHNATRAHIHIRPPVRGSLRTATLIHIHMRPAVWREVGLRLGPGVAVAAFRGAGPQSCNARCTYRQLWRLVAHTKKERKKERPAPVARR